VSGLPFYKDNLQACSFLYRKYTAFTQALQYLRWLLVCWQQMLLLFTPFTATFANPFKIRFANGICSRLNHFLTDFAVNAKSCVNSN